MLGHLIDTVSLLEQRDIGFRSLQEQIDTTTSGGKLAFHVFGALAEFSSTWSRERPQAGFTAARAPGRPKAVALPWGGFATACSAPPRSICTPSTCTSPTPTSASAVATAMALALALVTRDSAIKEANLVETLW